MKNHPDVTIYQSYEDSGCYYSLHLTPLQTKDFPHGLHLAIRYGENGREVAEKEGERVQKYLDAAWNAKAVRAEECLDTIAWMIAPLDGHGLDILADILGEIADHRGVTLGELRQKLKNERIRLEEGK